MRKILFVLMTFSMLFGACKKYSNTYMEKNAFDEKSGFRYFSKTVETPEQVFKLNDKFRKSRIGSKDREKYLTYSKIYFDDEQFPKQIENYKKHQFNSHVYYPYRIFKVEKNEKQIKISIIDRKWEKQKLVIGQMKVKSFSKEKERPLKELVDLLKKSPGDKSLIDKVFYITFKASNNKKNNTNQELLSVDRNFVPIEGVSGNFPEYSITLSFFDENRTTAGDIPLGKNSYIVGRLSEIKGKKLVFVFIDFDRKRAERKQSGAEKMENSIYSSK